MCNIRLENEDCFTMGDENSPNCKGCYWYDPKAFNKDISKDYKKCDNTKISSVL